MINLFRSPFRLALLLSLLVLFPPGLAPAAHALDPQGEFPIGPDDRAPEVGPSVARDPAGNVLLTFSRLTNYSQRFATVVAPLRLDGTFRSRTRSWGPGRASGVVFAGKNFIGLSTSYDSRSITVSQPLDAAGRAIGAPSTIGAIPYFNVRRNLAGGALLVGHDGARTAVLAQRFDSEGRPFGALTQLTSEASDLADCGSDQQGRMVVAWRRNSTGIAFRRYAADLTPLGDITLVPDLAPESLRVSVAPDGRFAIALRDARDLKAKLLLFHADGRQARPPLTLGTGEVYGSRDVDVAFDNTGRWLVIWARFSTYAVTDSQIYGRFVAADGSSMERPFLVAQANTYLAGLHSLRLLRTGPREFLVFWQKDIDVFVDSEIFARRIYDVPGGADPCVVQGGALRCDLKHDGGTAEVSYALNLQAGDRPLLADFDGDTRKDPCLFRSGTFLCDVDRDGVSETSLQLGAAGDIPLAGDLSGEGLDSFCVFKSGVFRCRQRVLGDPPPDLEVRLGAATDRPLLGDVDGDGRADLCVDDGAKVVCAITHASGGSGQVTLPAPSSPGWTPFLADIDNDGKADLCGYVGGLFSCHLPGTVTLSIPFGGRRAIPLMGDVDGR